MSELIKIREMSSKYDISARTLKYYEEMGLISSTRSDDYAYRMYDEDAVKRLEQILILRKLNISIKDIQRIFNTSGSEVVLEVLSKKVDNIDEEVSLLQELKEIVLEFIRQIEKADFGNESDVKLLYDKAKEIETQIVNVDYNGNTANINRFHNVTDKLRKIKLSQLNGVRVIDIPKFRAVSSGLTTFDEIFSEDSFDKWMQAHMKFVKMSIYGHAYDFMWGEDGKTIWIWAIEDWVTEADTAPYDIIEYEGGTFVVATANENDNSDLWEVTSIMSEWIEDSGIYKKDERPGHHGMGHMLACSSINKLNNIAQQEIFFPVKLRTK
jgi:DNA-binding transcriptional MerR regulator